MMKYMNGSITDIMLEYYQLNNNNDGGDKMTITASYSGTVECMVECPMEPFFGTELASTSGSTGTNTRFLLSGTSTDGPNTPAKASTKAADLELFLTYYEATLRNIHNNNNNGLLLDQTTTSDAYENTKNEEELMSSSPPSSSLDTEPSSSSSSSLTSAATTTTGGGSSSTTSSTAATAAADAVGAAVEDDGNSDVSTIAQADEDNGIVDGSIGSIGSSSESVLAVTEEEKMETTTTTEDVVSTTKRCC